MALADDQINHQYDDETDDRGEKRYDDQEQDPDGRSIRRLCASRYIHSAPNTRMKTLIRQRAAPKMSHSAPRIWKAPAMRPRSRTP